MRFSSPSRTACYAVLAASVSVSSALAQSIVPRYTNGVRSDASRHDGRLRPAIGVQNLQVVRAAPGNRTAPGTDGTAATYRHHPDMAYWNGRFYVSYVTNDGVMLATSSDARNWTTETLFAGGVRINNQPTWQHQRMGFYVAPNGKLVASTFYGRDPSPNDGQGYARVVRDVRGPGDLGPVFAARYNQGFDEFNTPWSRWFLASDVPFRQAVSSLLQNRLYRQQWYEEDRNNVDGFYSVVGNGSFEAKAFSWYTLPDGRVLGTWKGVHSVVAPASWNASQIPTPVKENVIFDADGKQIAFDQLGAHGTAKIFGARLSDGRYAMIYDAPNELHKRWPLVITTGDDGLTFDTPWLTVAGDIPVMRYPDTTPRDTKDAGPQYVRGITEGNGTVPGGDHWVTYSMNKEDIWVARVPHEVRYRVEGPVSDTFDNMSPGGEVVDWNIYSPQWAPAGVVSRTIGQNVLRLSDRDHHDYAKAVRVFEEGEQRMIRFDVTAAQATTGQLQIDLTDARGERPVQIVFGSNGMVSLRNGNALQPVAMYFAGRSMAFNLFADADADLLLLEIDGQFVASVPFAVDVASLERLEFRTGEYRLNDFFRRPSLTTGNFPTTTIANADVFAPLASFDIDNVWAGAIPEPTTLGLAGLALAFLTRRAR